MEASEDAELCFPEVNNSCKKTTRPHWEDTIICTVLSLVTVLTVVLNLLVIISISHFRQRNLSAWPKMFLFFSSILDIVVDFDRSFVLIFMAHTCTFTIVTLKANDNYDYGATKSVMMSLTSGCCTSNLFLTSKYCLLANAFTSAILCCTSACYRTIHTTTLHSFLHLTVCSVLIFSHFRQLHTTNNLLLLCLAVADFLVGFLLMPVEILFFRGCWTLGDFVCAVHYFTGFLVISVSVGCMVLISIDRYVAICDPMFYSTKVTWKRVQFSICLCWIFSALHSSWILRDYLKKPDRYNSCYGESVLILNYVEGAVDLIVTFFVPITVIIVLYMRVFVVAVSQARAMRSHNAAGTQHSKTTAKKSEMKAARTLGIAVVVFLMCSSPYFCITAAAEYNSVGSSSVAIQLWLLYLNSCLNPMIYAFFYPWFRKSITHIVTLQILKPGSREANLL